MNTDKHGSRQDRRSLQRTRKAFLMGEFVCISEFFSPSVSIRTAICENFVFRRQFSNAEARRTQSFAEFNFLRSPLRPLNLCVKASRRLVAASPLFPVHELSRLVASPVFPSVPLCVSRRPLRLCVKASRRLFAASAALPAHESSRLAEVTVFPSVSIRSPRRSLAKPGVHPWLKVF
jgi:hypothetical protein